jgi:hypothetical protein
MSEAITDPAVLEQLANAASRPATVLIPDPPDFVPHDAGAPLTPHLTAAQKSDLARQRGDE